MFELKVKKKNLQAKLEQNYRNKVLENVERIFQKNNFRSQIFWNDFSKANFWYEVFEAKL